MHDAPTTLNAAAYVEELPSERPVSLSPSVLNHTSAGARRLSLRSSLTLAAREHVQVRRDAVRIGPPAIDGEASTHGSEAECARPGALSSARGLAGGLPLPARRAQLQPPVRELVAPRPRDRGCEGKIGIAKLGCIVLSPECRCRSTPD